MMPRIKYKEAAGLKVKRGRPAKENRPNKADLQRLYAKESRSIREVAKVLGCSKDMVFRSLKEYKIARRNHTRNSKLERYDISFIMEMIKRVNADSYWFWICIYNTKAMLAEMYLIERSV